jgi:hypothetical protein
MMALPLVAGPEDKRSFEAISELPISYGTGEDAEDPEILIGGAGKPCSLLPFSGRSPHL